MEESKVSRIIRELKALHYIASILLFAYTWSQYKVRYEIVLAFRYDYYVVALYAAVLLFLERIYNAYSLEFTSAADCGFSLTLSTTISILLLYLVPLVAWKKFYPIQTYLFLIAVQTAWNFLWAFFSGWIYSAIQSPILTAIVFRSRGNAHRMDSVSGFKKRFKVIEFVEDPHNTGEIIASMGDCKAVVLADIDRDIRDEMVMYCAEKGIQVFLLPGLGDTILMSGIHMQSFSVPVVRVWPDVHPEYLFFKRILDIVFSVLAIVITSPIMLITAIAIHSYDKGPAIYRQVRLTRNGKTFEMLKFRSMRMDAEADGVARLSSGEDDSRITPIGRAIRMIRLDELPQLFNVLKGDMTLVGPRPERPEIAAQYEEQIPEFHLRLAAKAGLTGYAQIYGKYNSNPYEKLQMDILYINRMSFLVDLRIFFATVRVLFMKESTEGIKEGSITAMQPEEKKPIKAEKAKSAGTGKSLEGWNALFESGNKNVQSEAEEIRIHLVENE